MDDRKLESLLQSRSMEAPSPDFTGRIIASAYPRQVNEPLIVLLKRIFTEFMPQPAYAFAAVLLLGAALGFGLPSDTSYAQENYYEDGAL